MKFRTEIDIDRTYKGSISLEDTLFMVGSCFTSNIGERLLQSGFDATVNPFGTLYNPLSIESLICNAIDERCYLTDDLIMDAQGIWHSLDFHSSFSSENQGIVLDHINNAIKHAKTRLCACNWVIITFGTSYIYRWRASGNVVANCHKLHPDKFCRLMMSFSEVESSMARIINKIRAINPDVRFIFTVSPVRHKADGLHANQLSKSNLLLAVDSIVRQFDNIIYFPAYEILMDDLRDYRFYADDMVHPSQVAVRYIYDIFTDMFMSGSTVSQCAINEKKNLRQQHRTIVR